MRSARRAGLGFGPVALVVVALVATLVVTLIPRAALAQRTPVTSRDYALEFHQGPIVGGARMIGMGGATVAVGEGAVGVPRNPAAAAVRAQASRGTWDWDWNVDWLSARPGGDDLDNNGDDSASIKDTLSLTAGIVIQWHAWAFAISGEVQQYTVALDGSADDGEPSVALTHAVVARSFACDQVSVGLGVRGGNFTMARKPAGSDESQELLTMQGAGLEAGVVWRPAAVDVRLGASFAAPLTSIGGAIAPGDYRPEDYGGYILPERLLVPWELALGGGYRFGASRWNRRVAGDFRDERSLTVAADVLVTGASSGASGVEAFIDKELEPTGRSATLSVRGGVEVEAIPGWLRLRGGSYFEPSRFSGVSGRVHGTAGLEARLFSFCLWGSPYRARASVTVDVARRYDNLGLSVGFWH